MFRPIIPWIPSDNALTCCPNCRSTKRYLEVVDQFKVDSDPRYVRRDITGDDKPETFCNIFATDVAKSMGVLLPHWWMGKELSANYLWFWLHEHGPDYGWEGPLSPHVAQAQVMVGAFTIAIWHNPSGGPGHVAVVLPVATEDESNPWVAQAGAKNYARVKLSSAFPKITPELWSCR